MTPKEAAIEFLALKKSIGLKADVHVSINFHTGPALTAGVYPSGICHHNDEFKFHVEADDWPELLVAAREKWDEHKSRHRVQVIRKMALEIIRLTADNGECTDAALRTVFNAGDIAAYGQDACEDANNIAGKGPFKIKAKRGANAA